MNVFVVDTVLVQSPMIEMKLEHRNAEMHWGEGLGEHLSTECMQEMCAGDINVYKPLC